jgi:hypothetical protein
MLFFGVAGALGAASAINYAASFTDAGGDTVENCTDIGALLEGGLHGDYSITAAPITTTTTCTVTGTNSTTQTFTGHAVD